MGRVRNVAAVLGVGAAAVIVARRLHGPGFGHDAEGGVLIADAAGYDRHAGRLLGSLYRKVAAEIAAAASPEDRLLEVGCGPGRLSLLLARDHGLDVTGLDLDPEMIARARAHATEAASPGTREPAFTTGDVASLPFADGTFDLVVSTLSMHHWADPAGGLAEVRRVLKTGGRALVWDVRGGIVPLHMNAPDPVRVAERSPLRIVEARSWGWPWRLPLLKRLELAAD